MISSNKNFTVKTVSGKEVPRINCRFIQKEYYEINVDCFLMPDDRWHRINNGKIAFDHEDQKYVLIEDSRLINGIVGLDDKNKAITGYFSPNPLKNVRMGDSYCISDEIPAKLGYIEQINSGIFYPKGMMSESKFNAKGINARYGFELQYSAKSSIPSFKGAYDEGYKVVNKNNLKLKFPEELGNTSWGAEIETSNGFINERLCYRNGIIPLRDGSLRHDGIEPFEFTTIPLTGAKGLHTMIDIMDVMNKYTEIGDRCAFHLHIGGYEPSKEFIVALHRVMLRIQDEMYSMFPSNYKFTSQNGFKSKDYCAPIKNIRILKGNTVDQNFEILYNYYSGGNGSFRGFGASNHPKDRDNRQKWQIDERYTLCNCIPLIWGGSGTCEFRQHVPTLSITKMLNWLYICNAIMAYVQKNKTDIANWGDLRACNLDTILSSVYSTECAQTLSKYVQWRKDYMKTMDATGQKELAEDLMSIPYSVLS